MEVDQAWPRIYLWIYETHFYFNGNVNTQDSRIWASEQPHAFQENLLHSQKIIFWYGFVEDFIIGPYFFVIFTQTGLQTRKRSKIVIPKLQQTKGLDKIIFMEDGAPPLIATSVQQLLRHYFAEKKSLVAIFVLHGHFATQI